MPRPVTTALLLLVLPILVLSACDDPTAPAIEPQDGVLFISNRSGTYDSYDIFRMNADGSDVRNLTEMPALNYGGLDLSPDGDRVVFASRPELLHDIYVMDVEGEERVRLTGNDPDDHENHYPHWSPDGSMIAFGTMRELRHGWSVYVMNADGSDPRNVAPSLEPSGCGCNQGSIPIGWTPDGRVVFEHYDGEFRLYTVHPDGTGLEPVFQEPGDYAPRWSPDGSLIAFIRDGNIHLMNADGSGVRRLTESDTGYDLLSGSSGWSGDTRSWPDPWSPDGTRIVFYNWTPDGTRLHVIDQDGTGLRALTERESVAFTGWSPDGERILYAKAEVGGDEVYAVSPDGTDRTNLTNSPTDDERAVWVPRRQP